MTGFHPTEPLQFRLADGRFGASPVVAIDRSERPIGVESAQQVLQESRCLTDAKAQAMRQSNCRFAAQLFRSLSAALHRAVMS